MGRIWPAAGRFGQTVRRLLPEEVKGEKSRSSVALMVLFAEKRYGYCIFFLLDVSAFVVLCCTDGDGNDNSNNNTYVSANEDRDGGYCVQYDNYISPLFL